MLPLLLALLAPPAVQSVPLVQDSLPGLGGVVRLGENAIGEPLRGAVIEVRQGTRLRRVRSDESGRYQLFDLSPGPADLLVAHLAARPLEISLRLPERGFVEVDLSLRRQVIQLSEIRVIAASGPDAPVAIAERAAQTRVAIGLRALEASPGMAESGLASILASEEPPATDNVLYLRGSTVDARLVLLDGAPVLTPFHVAGLVEPFEPELLGRADQYLGGAPAPYTDGISYLLDVETRSPRRDGAHVSAAVDGVTAGGSVELPLPLHGGLLVGGRVLHGLQEAQVSDRPFPYRYDDLLVRLGVSPVAGHDLRVTGFQNHEGVRLDFPGVHAPAGWGEAEWGNRAASLGYEGVVGGTSLRSIGAISRYESTLPVDWRDPVVASGIGDRARVLGEAAFSGFGGTFRVGASLERLTYRYALAEAVDALAPIPGDALELGTTAAGGFGEWDAPVAPGWRLRAGIRADRFSHEGRIRLAPRAALTIRLGSRATLTASTGVYHQVLPAPGLKSQESLDGSPASLQWDPSLPVASAYHFVVGLEQQMDAGVDLGLSAFVKSFRGLETIGDRSSASGAELRVSREGAGLSGWFGYTLSWFWVDEGPGGSTRFDGRHLVSLGLEGTLPGGVELLGRLGYGAGLPVTAVGLPSGSDGESFQMIVSGATPEEVLNAGGGAAPLELAPVEDFLRLDLEVARSLNPTLWGRTSELRPYLRIVNALNRRDPLFSYYDRWLDEESRPLAEQPFIPLVGLEWRF